MLNPLDPTSPMQQPAPTPGLGATVGNIGAPSTNSVNAMNAMPTLASMQLSEAAQAMAAEVIEQARQQSSRQQGVSNLASYVRKCWQAARDHRRAIGVEERMQQALRQRKGEYDPDKLAAIRALGGSEIYMMLTSVKCRAAAAWLKDVMTGTGTEKPWAVDPTPVPTLPPGAEMGIRTRLAQEVGRAVASGLYPTKEEVDERLAAARTQMSRMLDEKARLDAKEVERRMEDVLTEGGWGRAMDLVVDDFVTFPAAIMAGPLLRTRPVLEWSQSPTLQPDPNDPAGEIEVMQWQANPVPRLREEYERVSPFDFYPDPNATTVDDGYMIRHHRMPLARLAALKGSPGYDDAAIDAAIEEHGRGGLREWLTVDSRTGELNATNPYYDVDWTALIDALEFWGAVPGSALIEWGVQGVDPSQANTMFEACVWQIGTHTIKAMLNPNALGGKPFARACYEEIPGQFWGNGVPDLIRDVQTVCNATARALVNNMGIASGPQVWINTDRVPVGTDLTRVYPWKVWTVTSDDMGSTAPPMDFFQPDMNAGPLLTVYEKFSILADEYSGIPRYMTGDQNTAGAASTASGLSMLMGNANKLMKKVVGNLDRMVENVLQQLHLHLLHVRRDPAIRGDIRVVVRGALAVTVKDTMQLRRQELLVQTANPMDSQILGLDGRAELWRESLRGLGVNPDKIIPPPEVMMERNAQAMAQQAAQAAQGGGAPSPGASPPAGGGAPGMPPPGGMPPPPDPMMSQTSGGYPGDLGLMG